jgi:hypothetical protein
VWAGWWWEGRGVCVCTWRSADSQVRERPIGSVYVILLRRIQRASSGGLRMEGQLQASSWVPGMGNHWVDRCHSCGLGIGRHCDVYVVCV